MYEVGCDVVIDHASCIQLYCIHLYDTIQCTTEFVVFTMVSYIWFETIVSVSPTSNISNVNSVHVGAY